MRSFLRNSVALAEHVRARDTILASVFCTICSLCVEVLTRFTIQHRVVIVSAAIMLCPLSNHIYDVEYISVAVQW